MINFMTLKNKSFLKNPIIIFSITSIILALILYVGTKFNLPDYYKNRDAAFLAAQFQDELLAYLTLHNLENIQHKIYNSIFQIFGWSISLLFTILLFKINSFEKFKKLIKIHNKKLIYIGINLSYIIFSISWVFAFMADIEKYVYTTYSDSFAIPFFSTITTLSIFALIYYPVMNLIFYLTYNTKISNKFLIFLLTIPGLFAAGNILQTFFMLFTMWNLLINICNIFWIFVSISAIKYLIEKRQKNIEVSEKSQTNC